MWFANPSSYGSFIHYTLPVSRRFQVSLAEDKCAESKEDVYSVFGMEIGYPSAEGAH
jgi:hypothetical protein